MVTVKVTDSAAVLIFKCTVNFRVLLRNVQIHFYVKICLNTTYIHVSIWPFISEFNYISILVSQFHTNQEITMCDKLVLKLREGQQALTRMPKILLQRAEHTFPVLKENIVSVLCMKVIVSLFADDCYSQCVRHCYTKTELGDLQIYSQSLLHIWAV